MKFEWDQYKRLKNVAKHGLDLADAPKIFKKPMVIRLDTRQDYDEDRFIGIGLLTNKVVVVVYCEVDEETTRIISLRKAVKREQKLYYKSISH